MVNQHAEFLVVGSGNLDGIYIYLTAARVKPVEVSSR